MVSLKDFPTLDKPTDSLKVTDPKTGETGYRVGLEVFHQLHCLNLLRMSTYPNAYNESSWALINRVHIGTFLFMPPHLVVKANKRIDHCIEVLRVNLMCMADVNVFTFHEMPGKEGYWPDYESNHVCRNFDKIKDWAYENAVPEEEGV